MKIEQRLDDEFDAFAEAVSREGRANADLTALIVRGRAILREPRANAITASIGLPPVKGRSGPRIAY